MRQAQLYCHASDDSPRQLILSGHWSGRVGTAERHALESAVEQAGSSTIQLLAGDEFTWEASFPAFIHGLIQDCFSHNQKIDCSAMPDSLQTLFTLAAAVPPNTAQPATGQSRFAAIQQVWNEVIDTLVFIGEMKLATLRLLTGRSHMRAVDAVSCLNQAGPQAIGIITLISILVGMILAYLGIIQLRQFGAEVYVANLVAVGMVREMGALMTAVIMAGRTGASWAAELGAMKVNEEVDALTTMGIRPMDFLVMPRLLAMTITMPLLCIYSFLLGMLGGGVIAMTMDMTPRMYLFQLLSSFTPVDVVVGCFKGLVFGWLIVLAGCQAGMNCGSSSAAVGRATTRAVVLAIVFFVVADAGLNIMFYHLDI
ncbi:MlaE family ABC transporter permease [Sansalvadorimonas verongulae]|uniref:MlaE family ABC transporter permease n=1 Tax=Sansalvadorimonas verongulae TaxID=2172824 RepID=UPI0012BBE884|nr:ABC transporter permease [Sansalvadorimonas verongulae]MTI14721.1 ABC transporter permease [Sansalvadorimonas verongulae]